MLVDLGHVCRQKIHRCASSSLSEWEYKYIFCVCVHIVAHTPSLMTETSLFWVLDQGLLDPREVGRLLPQPQSMMMAQISQRNSSSSSLANDQEVDLEYNPE